MTTSHQPRLVRAVLYVLVGATVWGAIAWINGTDSRATGLSVVCGVVLGLVFAIVPHGGRLRMDQDAESMSLPAGR